ncbi:MAG: enediyne biosynthesis protein [Chloroflexota bacterium]|jgi:hypothetical protein|nr:enediyne biosynthesis protein [Chloroflexota bacterium]
MKALAPFKDLRLRVSVVIMGLQVLGQVAFGFKVSIAQILVAIALCVVIEVGVGWWRRQTLTWPASAILTGNGIALILRATGTHHGDWWSLNGIHYFALAAVIGIGSKYLVRFRGRHVYNPSNLGLVLCLLVAGPLDVFPQYLWWGNVTPALLIAFVLILVGAAWVLVPLRMVPMAFAFLVPFFTGMALFAVTGHCFVAIWNPGPACGLDYWAAICLSPELLVFVFFMLTDPRTTPEGATARLVHAALTALLALGFIAFQPTEYGIKLGLLAALTVSCSVNGLGRGAAAWRARDLVPSSAPEDRRPLPLVPGTIALVVVIALAVPLYLAGLSGNQDLRAVEKGRPPPGIRGQA